MYLKRLEIQGFKSFAHKTTLEFSQGIIAIVGPNGSGKSNVADCLRWVLGEQSAKLIRGKKSDDVIFAGSEKKTKMGFAEVIATFDNRDHRIPVDASEVSIGRRVDRSGESEYLLNGNRVRLLDIVDLVLKSNIGTSRYTVIGQGTIDQMILAGPSEVKNLLDEASGVKNYYIKREKTLRRLEQTAQNLMRAEDLIAEIEPRLKSLRRQAKRMEARGEIETELRVYNREYFGKTYWALKSTVDGYLGRIGELEKKKKVLEEEIALHRKQAEQHENQNVGQVGKFKEIQDQLSKLQSQKNKILEDMSLVRGKMQSQKTSVVGDAKTLQVQLHELGRKIIEIKDNIEKTSGEQHGISSQFKQQSEALGAINVQLDHLYASMQNPSSIDWPSFERELSSLETALQDLYNRVEQGQPLEAIRPVAHSFRDNFNKFKEFAKSAAAGPGNMSQFQQQLKLLLSQKEKINAEVSQLELSLSKSRIYIEFLEKEKETLEKDRLHLDLELKKAQSHSADDFLKDLITEEDKLKKEIEGLSNQITELEKTFRAEQHAEGERHKELREAEIRLRAKQDELSKLKDQESGLQIEKAKYDTQMEVLMQEMHQLLGSEIVQNIQDKPVEGNTPDLEAKIMKLKNQLDMIGGIDELTMKEYQETESRYTNLSTQVHDLKQGMTDLRSIMDELDEHIKSKFNEAFHKINEKFENYFRILFNGGRAYLSVLKNDEQPAAEQEAGEDSEPMDSQSALRPEEKIVQKYEKGSSNIIGIDIKATPPNKKLSSIQALSGGERALTSIALLCSLLTCFPSPFVVLDEVDAALDDANTIRFGQILGTLAHQTQFITITHNRETMAQANVLYGVTMGDDGISKLLSVKLDQAKQYAK